MDCLLWADDMKFNTNQDIPALNLGSGSDQESLVQSAG